MAFPSEVRVNWDSGSGFNDMESEDLVFGGQTKGKSGDKIIRIKKVGKSHPAAKSAEVRIKAITHSHDAKPLDLRTLANQKGIELTAEGYLRFRGDVAELKVPVGGEYRMFCFIADPMAGFVEIELDDDRRLYDLYSEHSQDRWIKRERHVFAPGDFTARVNLPRYDIRRIQIKAQDGLHTFRVYGVTVSSSAGESSLPLYASGLFSNIVFSEIPGHTRRRFHPVQFMQQVIFSSFCAYLVLFFLRFVRSRGGFKNLLIGEKRLSFWLMFAGALVCFSLWLLAYWPGHLTTDSIHIWWAAKQPDYLLHEHPFINILYYRFLQNIWDHFAVVGLFQIFVASLLGAYIFYHLYKSGLPFILILPFYLWFVSSVPIGLYNISLWKDIPFAFLVVFWAYYFVRLRLNQLNNSKEPQIHPVVLILLLLCVSLFRYNGLIYLVLIPLGMAIYQHASLKKITSVSLVVFLIALAGIIFTSVTAKHDFVFGLTKKFAVKLYEMNPVDNIKAIVTQYPQILDDRNKHTWWRDSEVMGWHQAFTREKKYNDFVKYYDVRPKSEILFLFLDHLMRSSHDVPYVWISWNPVYLLYLFLLGGLYRWFPLVSAYTYILLPQTFFLLMFLLVIHGGPHFDWRYNFYLFLAGIFLIPLILFDVMRRRQNHGVLGQ